MPVAVRLVSLTVPAVAALVGIVAVVDPVLALILAVAVVFAAVMLTDFAAGICLFAFASALFEGVPEFGAFSAAKVIGLALAISWLATVAFRGSLRDEIVAHSPLFTALLALFALWCGASALWAEDSSIASSEFTRLALNLLLIPIAFSAINDERTLRLLIAGLLAGLLLSALYGIVTGAGVAQGEERLAGSGLDANYLALFLIMACTLAYGIYAGDEEPAVRGLVMLAIAVSAVAAFTTASRTGLVALAAVLLAAPFLAGRGRRAGAVAICVLVVGGGVIYFSAFASETVRNHVSSRNDGGSGRTDIWKVGMRMAKANPAAGVGLGNFQSSTVHYLLEPGQVERTEHIVDKPKVAHNTYLQWFAETGAVGGALFVLLVMASFGMAMRAARAFAGAGRRSAEALSRAIAIAVIGISAGAFFVSLHTAKPLWLLLALGPVMLKLARREGVVT